MKRALIVLLIVAAVGAGAGAYYIRRGGPEIQVNTAPITRGDIVDTVGATGTLQAVTTVQVGSQVSGNIQWLGADFNSIVKKGQVIARLDPSLFEAQLQQARANLTQTRANLTKAQSDLERTKVQLTDAQQKYARAKELAAQQPAAAERARRREDRGRHGAGRRWQSQQATVTQAQAAVTQSQASVNQNQVNLDHTVITAPIDGIVTQRSVDVGQTVAASMQAPTLFVIAADLTKMQVNANIDEADVGRIRPGPARDVPRRRVPDRQRSRARSSQIRLQPVVVQNVTTYGTVIDVPNPQLKLKPGMTANVKVEIAKRTDVLRVPNAALRFRPTPEMFAALNQAVPPEAHGRRRTRPRRARPAVAAAAATRTPAAAPATRRAGGSHRRRPRSQRTRGLAAAPRDDRRSRTGSGAPARRQGASAGGGRRRRRSAAAADGGGGGRGIRSGAHDGTLQGDVARRTAAVHRADERARPGHQRVRSSAEAGAKPAAPSAASAEGRRAGAARRRSTRCSRRCRPSNRAAARGCSSNQQLKPVNLRLGISDGTNTELLSGELQQGMEVVTGVTGLGTTRDAARPAAAPAIR